MTMLTVGTFTNVPVANDGAKETPELIRDRQRMQDGSMRVLDVAQKRNWSITTKTMAESDASDLRDEVTTTSLPVTCSGDLLGGSVACVPELTGYQPVNVSGTLMYKVSFTLFEA